MKIVYVGELSGGVLGDLGIEFQRGCPFEVPDIWGAERVKQDPERWKAATDTAAPATPEVDRTVIEPDENVEPDGLGKTPVGPKRSTSK